MEMNQGVLTIDFKDINIVQLALQTGAGMQSGVKALFKLNGQDPAEVTHVQLVTDAKGEEFAEAALRVIKEYVSSQKLH
ncbi:hypothetical protein [Bacillus massiliigorillae]|uniref:hypothetical protein n=1 Tax=Bacillus massiliigorillae TaxID=1243664 RepID=UPI0003A5510B|nr:hypothetical protein [Bacillus massiliigorillae]